MKNIRKYTWLGRVLQRMLSGEIGILEGINFARSAFSDFRSDFILRKIVFRNADFRLWKQALDIFFRKEYTSAGFEIGKADVVIDIGANRGIFIALAASYTNGKILAFEPGRDNYSEIQNLVDVNKLHQVQVQNSAVAGQDGYVKLFLAAENTRHSILGQDMLTGKTLDNYVDVSAISLDEALREVPCVDFLKMDCEGAEFEIFSNVHSSTMSKIKRIVLEYHSFLETNDVQNLIHILENEGFSVKVKPSKDVPLGLIFAIRNKT